MKKAEMKKIVNGAIKECNLNGYKWKFDGEKLHWDYLTVEYFTIEVDENEDYTMVEVFYHLPHVDCKERFTYAFVGDCEYTCDCKTIEEAIALVTKKTISIANHTF